MTLSSMPRKKAQCFIGNRMDGYAIRLQVDCVPEKFVAGVYDGSGLPACSCTM